MICLPPSCSHIRCPWTDFHWWQPIWLQRVRCLANNNALRTMWAHQIMMLEIHRAKTLNLGNPRINFIHHSSIVTGLRKHDFQALTISTTLPHSTRDQAHNQTQLQPKDIGVMGHRGKDTIPSKEVMVDLKCSPLSNSQHRGCQLQADLGCLKHHLKMMQSFGRHLPPQLHMAHFAAQLGDTPWSFQQTILARGGTAQDRCCRDRGFAPITRDFLWPIRCRLWVRWFVGLGQGWGQSSIQLEANGILLEAICQKDGAAQL